jgi:hypothetical protein
MATPKRGPDIVLPVESRLYVKLMSPIYVEMPKVAAAVPQALQPAPQIPLPVPQAVAPVSAADSLDLLVAPVALYPDAILRDLLRASTFPFEVIQANQWVHQRRDFTGSLPPIGYNESWDPSVKGLTAYPDLLQRMTTDLNWLTKLGSAFEAQPYDVMNAVQRQRLQAHTLRPVGISMAASAR